MYRTVRKTLAGSRALRCELHELADSVKKCLVEKLLIEAASRSSMEAGTRTCYLELLLEAAWICLELLEFAKPLSD